MTARRLSAAIGMVVWYVLSANPKAQQALAPILSANTLVRVRDRLLFAYVYTPNLDPAHTAKLTAIARSWTDAIVAVNAHPSR